MKCTGTPKKLLPTLFFHASEKSTAVSDFGQNVDAHESDANLIDHLLPRKGFCIYSIMIQGSPKFFERFDYSE
jgi:hypothetical protein